MNTKTRIVGSNFTTFVFNGQPIAWCDQVTDSGQKAGVGQAYEAIFPLGYYHPVEFATTRVLSEGTLMMRVRELWNAPAWTQLQGLANTNNIVEIMQAVASSPTPISAQMIIKPAGSSTWRGWTYHNIVVTDVQQGESIALGNLTMPRDVTAAYTHRTPLTTTATQIVY